MFWPLLLNSKHSGVPKDSKSPTLGVWVSSSHLAKVGLRHAYKKGIVPIDVVYCFATGFVIKKLTMDNEEWVVTMGMVIILIEIF